MSTIRILLFSPFLWLISCGVYNERKAINIEKTVIQNKYFSNIQTEYVYKSSIEFYKYHFSGLLIIKPIEQGKHRVAITTDFGNKLLDFTISEFSFDINYVVKELNRKPLLRMLRDDLRILLKNKYLTQQKWENDHYLIYRNIDKNKYTDLYFNTKNSFLEKIVYAHRNKEKINIVFLDTEKDSIALRFRIEHYNIPLKIELSLLN